MVSGGVSVEIYSRMSACERQSDGLMSGKMQSDEWLSEMEGWSRWWMTGRVRRGGPVWLLLLFIYRRRHELSFIVHSVSSDQCPADTFWLKEAAWPPFSQPLQSKASLNRSKCLSSLVRFSGTFKLSEKKKKRKGRSFTQALKWNSVQTNSSWKGVDGEEHSTQCIYDNMKPQEHDECCWSLRSHKQKKERDNGLHVQSIRHWGWQEKNKERR